MVRLSVCYFVLGFWQGFSNENRPFLELFDLFTFPTPNSCVYVCVFLFSDRIPLPKERVHKTSGSAKKSIFFFILSLSSFSVRPSGRSRPNPLVRILNFKSGASLTSHSANARFSASGFSRSIYPRRNCVLSKLGYSSFLSFLLSLASFVEIIRCKRWRMNDVFRKFGRARS